MKNDSSWFWDVKTRRVIRWPWKIAIFMAMVLILYLARKPILISMAEYLHVPCEDACADVVIIEGGYFLSNYHMKAGLRAFEEGLVSKILITINNKQGEIDIFGLKDFESILYDALDSLGVDLGSVHLLYLDIKPPFTINTAMQVAAYCKSQGFDSALLVNDNFHMRRSILAYRAVFRIFDLQVYPFTYEIYINSTNWWKASTGVRRVFGEYIKILYYWHRGYFNSSRIKTLINENTR
ncbi:hypothetical protein GF406_18290 [candidate division KSB1 bacterium]|nr:hypothetical protein [candidate division KSB1 bacterium]